MPCREEQIRSTVTRMRTDGNMKSATMRRVGSRQSGRTRKDKEGHGRTRKVKESQGGGEEANGRQRAKLESAAYVRV